MCALYLGHLKINMPKLTEIFEKVSEFDERLQSAIRPPCSELLQYSVKHIAFCTEANASGLQNIHSF